MIDLDDLMLHITSPQSLMYHHNKQDATTRNDWNGADYRYQANTGRRKCMLLLILIIVGLIIILIYKPRSHGMPEVDPPPDVPGGGGWPEPDDEIENGGEGWP